MNILDIKELVDYVKNQSEEKIYLIGEPIYDNKFVEVVKEEDLDIFILEKMNISNNYILEKMLPIKIEGILGINEILELLEFLGTEKQIEIITDYLNYSIVKL